MTEPILTARKRNLTEADTEHPLATQNGINILMHLIESDKVWSGCTKPQRALLNELCPPVAERVAREGSATTADMPLLPGRVTARSRAALRRRGLVDDDGRLTATAVHTWYWRNEVGEAS